MDEQAEPRQRGRERARGRRTRRLVFGQEREELPCAAADVGGERAVDDDDERAGRARRASPAVVTGRAFGPAQDRAVGIGGIGGRQHDDFRFVRRVLERSQEVERGRQRELRRADAAREVATAYPAGVLERLQDVVDRAEAAGDAFGRRDLAGQDAVAGEELLRERGRGLRRRTPSRRPAPSSATSGPRRSAAPSRRLRNVRRAARLCARVGLAARAVGWARERAHRVQAVVRDRASPHERPDRVDGLARVAAARGLVHRREERRAVAARGASRIARSRSGSSPARGGGRSLAT